MGAMDMEKDNTPCENASYERENDGGVCQHINKPHIGDKMESSDQSIDADCLSEGKSQLMGMGTTMVDLMMPGECTNRIEGIIKYIPEDFVVNEIDPTGRIVISRRSVRPTVATQAVEHERNRTSGEAFLKLRKIGNPIGTMKYPSNIFTKEDSIRMDALLDDLVSHMSDMAMPEISWKKPPFCLVMLCDDENQKELRTRAHVFIRENLPFLESVASPLAQFREQKESAQYVGRFMSQAETADENRLVVKVFPRKTCILAINAVRAASEDWSSDALKDLPAGNSPTLDSVVRHLDITDYSNFPDEFKERQKMKQYLHFSVQKRDRSTHEITHMLCRALHRSSHDIFTAGNKDRRAVTTQKFCIRRAKIEDFVEAMAQSKWIDGVVVSDFYYSPERLRLGDLRGNSFWVTIRGIQDVTSARLNLESLRVHGFLNYFGLQRFGSLHIGTHMVGAAMLRRDYEGVARLIVNDDEAMNRYLAAIGVNGKENEEAVETAQPPNMEIHDEGSQRGFQHERSVVDPLLSFKQSPKRHRGGRGAGYKPQVDTKGTDLTTSSAVGTDVEHIVSGNTDTPAAVEENEMGTLGASECGTADDSTTIKQGPRSTFIERELISGMARKQRIEDVLRRIPANVLSIYVHATQSLVFNYVLTERLKKYGMKPIPGDFVIRASPSPIANSYETKMEGATTHSPTCPPWESYEEMAQQVRVVEADDVESWSIYDIVLPLPGDNVDYPAFLKPVYERVAKEHFDLSLDMFTTVIKELPPRLKGRERCLVGVGGGYRHIVARAHNLQYYVIPELSRNTEVTPKAPPPFMHLKGQRSAHAEQNTSAQHMAWEHTHDGDTECMDCKVSTRNTLVVSCALPKSCYLTCALREVLSDESLERQHIS
ncbi:tRNA pseudouridine synthase D (TruD) domain containing protein [Babesia divergens]|uniref:tRNA pseudouridine synthase D (TruD) domain containing protein n=1 Tax=Babesia divergens TaxID=32595 RepID=A0AAD9GHS0_BABDI|nr:tRNA pseudouridine synthase D (TruD) domain containing protein [Babesia divergens]